MRGESGILYLSHGGGPLPLLGDARHQELVTALESIATSLPRPEAIVLFSAHWEAARATVTTGARPPLIYDYYGFPPESYEITYPCPGLPSLADEVLALLRDAGLEADGDEARGFDHGLFVPLKLMYPEADIPCVQVSLLDSLDAGEHLALGRALRDLRSRNLLFIGSGFSFHNMKAFFETPTPETEDLNLAFEAWLIETCADPDLAEAERERRLVEWSNAPGARFCHPREEHLLPLHLCYGLAGARCTQFETLRILGRHASLYRW